MLIGFTIVAAPLLFAIVNAAVQMNRLSNRSEQLVVHGMQGTRSNQRMFEEIGALERTARLYQIIPNAELLDVYARNQERLEKAINEMLTLPLDAAIAGRRAGAASGCRTRLAGAQGGPAEFAAPGGADQLLSAVGRSRLQDIESRQRTDRPAN